MQRSIGDTDFRPEFIFKAVRSSGPGGQNVNKVNTRVELRFDVRNSNLINAEEKTILISRLGRRISKEGFILVVSQSERSQLKNKDECIKKFYLLLEKALKPKKKRTPTSPTLSSKKKRLEGKKLHSEKKVSRSKKLATQDNDLQ